MLKCGSEIKYRIIQSVSQLIISALARVRLDNIGCHLTTRLCITAAHYITIHQQTNIFMPRQYKCVLQDYSIRSVWIKCSPNYCHKFLQCTFQSMLCINHTFIVHVLLPRVSPNLVSVCLCWFVIMDIGESGETFFL